MSDAELRALERRILAEPASLELRRLHATHLQRAGDDERALGALDLAWRLGADDLWEPLRAALGARRIHLGRAAGDLTLCYVPRGPFAMGSDDLDADAAPAHLVHLSAFYVAREPLTLGTTTEQPPPWWSRLTSDRREWYRKQTATMNHDQALAAVARLDRVAPPPGLHGRWALITEAQWERVFRAAYARSSGESPYGAVLAPRSVEWAADVYDPSSYAGGPRRDPTGPSTGELRVVRGVPRLPAPLFAVFREAARPDGRFEVEQGEERVWLHVEGGVAARPVFLPDPAGA